MNNIDKWGVDIFKIGELTNNRPLTAVTFTTLQVSERNDCHIIIIHYPVVGISPTLQINRL